MSQAISSALENIAVKKKQMKFLFLFFHCGGRRETIREVNIQNVSCEKHYAER